MCTGWVDSRGLRVYWMGGLNGVKCVLVGWVQGGKVCTVWVDSMGLSVYWLAGFKGVKCVLVGWTQWG